MKRLYIDVLTDGCIESFLDFTRSRTALENGGWSLVDQPEEADLVLTNSCVVGEIVEQHCVDAISALRKRMRPNATLAVTGCMPAFNTQKLDELGVDFYFSSRQLHLLFERFDLQEPPEIGKLDKPSMGPYNKFNWATPLLRQLALMNIPVPQYLHRRFVSVETPDMFFLRVNRGCLESCSYCATKFTVGRLTSEDPDHILCRLDMALQEGERNIVLCGEETASFGRDTGTRFTVLLEKILSRKQDFMLHIRQHHPRFIIAELDKYCSLLADPRVRSITIPLQSGSDRILDLMKRRQTAADGYRVIESIHSSAPHVALRTHLIVGFPTETWGDFMTTHRLARDLPWDMVLAYPFTNRPGTIAAKLTPKVPTWQIVARMTYIYSMIMRKLYLNNFSPFPLTTRDPTEIPKLFGQ